MSDVVTAEAIVRRLELQPHPEGGWYRETWKGPDIGGRASGTAILFLLQAGEQSHWHRVDADEIWLWHAGAPLILSMGVDQAGETRLGPDVLGGEAVQTSMQLPQALSGVFQGLLLFCLLGADLFVNYRLRRVSRVAHG